MITRDELKESPEYKKAKALDKIILENAYLPEARKYREIPEFILGTIGTIGMPILTFYLAKKGMFPNNDIDTGRYIAAGIVGLIAGYEIGMCLGTIAYETLSKEGDINKLFSNCKKYFSEKNKE